MYYASATARSPASTLTPAVAPQAVAQSRLDRLHADAPALGHVDGG
ncbi:uncharacterized protein SOCEGT47_060480 [Sorangium cellulosum]|uniref:Uncharacterized protein n=1 Tax=Sorangium cellulosum TaxID=56 RepID=A0A4P2Q8D1_SORCE|nr:hypothetical protein [Sorangium cellulosum]AUX25501.1 uncharacterized protein SOCEGT47_060480 [Sorangium cellulosum]